MKVILQRIDLINEIAEEDPVDWIRQEREMRQNFLTFLPAKEWWMMRNVEANHWQYFESRNQRLKDKWFLTQLFIERKKKIRRKKIWEKPLVNAFPNNAKVYLRIRHNFAPVEVGNINNQRLWLKVTAFKNNKIKRPSWAHCQKSHRNWVLISKKKYNIERQIQ